MILDTSAVFAALVGEPDGDRYREIMKQTTDCRISAVTLYECRVVLGGRGGAAMLAEFDTLLRSATIQIDAFDERQAELAHTAYRRFGKGSRHPAQLNFADCAAYALATSLDLPLLFKGNDFARTDVKPAI
jgi:ribonuclease VapC